MEVVSGREGRVELFGAGEDLSVFNAADRSDHGCVVKIGVGLVPAFTDSQLRDRLVVAVLDISVHGLGFNYAGRRLRRTVSRRQRAISSAVRRDVDPRTGRKLFTPATVAALLVFFVFALQCMSTLAVMRRETNSWRWPVFAFSYLLALGYGASFVTYRLVESLTAST